MASAGRMMGGIAVSLMLSACGPGTVEPVPTVDYYRAHAEEREAQIKKCANSPGTDAQIPACVNAKAAARIEGIGRLRDLPPLGLGNKDDGVAPSRGN